MESTPTGHLDDRFSEPECPPPAWADVERLLEEAELYWLTTVRADRRPHVTPLVGAWVDGSFAFATGPGEQKHRNLEAGPEVAVTTGVNRWAAGTDVVVEGRAERVTGRDRLEPLAAAWRAKYGQAWDWQADEEGFHLAGDDDNRPWVYVVRPAKVVVFSKDPHGQTTFRPGR